MKTELELFYLSAQKLVSQDAKTKNMYTFGMSVVPFDSLPEQQQFATIYNYFNQVQWNLISCSDKRLREQ